MPLSSKDQLGRYEIRELLGAGGMGEVYLAHDPKLDRDVAVKVLPDAIAKNASAVERFEREARAVAALEHPNILAIYDFGTDGGYTWAAMELLRGQTLRERLAEGPIPPRKAIELASQLAEALGAAHGAGIIHRDIKPDNVFVNDNGQLKVLDFGLAGDRNVPADDCDTEALTQTKQTVPGTVLGTAGYMSPEQVRGEAVDHRSDVFSFGCVLYEMLTGRQVFKRDTVAETMTAVLREEPPDLVTPVGPVPPALERVVRRCLEKNPAERFQSANDLAFAITYSSSATASQAVPPMLRGVGGGRARAATVLGAVLALVAAFVLGRSQGPESKDESPHGASRRAKRTVLNLPDSAPLALGVQLPLIGFESPVLALSPDGLHLVYVGQAENGTRLYHHDLSRFDDPRPIDGTEDALYAFFSPDSAELGFLTTDRVKKVPLGGGAATTLCRAYTPVSASWIGDTIYFIDSQGRSLNSVPAGGGEPSMLLEGYRFWAVLPDAKAALARRSPGHGTWDPSGFAARAC